MRERRPHAPGSAGRLRHAQSAARRSAPAASSTTCARSCRASSSSSPTTAPARCRCWPCAAAPTRLFNVHLDTVPSSPAWSADPHRAARRRRSRDRPGRLRHQGRGRLPARRGGTSRRAGARMLFSSDEEANDARCIAALPGAAIAATARRSSPSRRRRRRCSRIAASPRRASPSAAQAGHASAPNALELQRRAPGHALGRARRSTHVESQAHARFGGLTGLRFNIGRIEGGIKGNVIAPSGEARFNFRPLPSHGHRRAARQLPRLRRRGALEAYEETFRGPSLPAGDIAQAEERRLAARDLADELGLPIGNAVDFWTEASLFSAAGYTALVYGPGDIAQAHTADEWVALAQLDEVASARYLRIMGGAEPMNDLRPHHRAPAVQHGQRQGDPAVPQALLAARRGELRRGQGRRRDPARRTRRAGVLARLPAAGRPDADRGARRRPAARRGDGGGRHRQEDRRRPARHRRRRCCRWCGASSSRRTCAWSRRCRRRACAPPRSPPACSKANCSTRRSTAWSARS